MSKKKPIPGNDYATMVITLTKIEAHAASIESSVKIIADWVETLRSASRWLKFIILGFGALIKLANIPPELKEKVLYITESLFGILF